VEFEGFIQYSQAPPTTANAEAGKNIIPQAAADGLPRANSPLIFSSSKSAILIPPQNATTDALPGKDASAAILADEARRALMMMGRFKNAQVFIPANHQPSDLDVQVIVIEPPQARPRMMVGSKSGAIFTPENIPAPQPPAQPATANGNGDAPTAQPRPLMAPGSKSIDMLLFGQSSVASVPGEATLDFNSPGKARFLEKPAPTVPMPPNAATAQTPVPATKPTPAKPAPSTGSIWPRPRSSFMAPSSKLGLIFFTPWGPVRSGFFVTAKIVDANGQPIVSDDDAEEPVDELPMPELAPSSQPAVNFKSVKPSAPRP